MTSGGVELQLWPVANGEGALTEALRESKILDTLPEPAYDDLADLARTIAGTPIAAITVIDRDRVWFKAVVGLQVTDIPASNSFCAALLENPTQPLIVEDTLEDPRFQNYAFVIGEPHIRAYVGVPLRNPEGVTIGSLCVFDYMPRSLTPAQISALEKLARQATALIHLRRTVVELDTARNEAQIAVRVKNAFLGNMSHELRTPMNGIIGLTGLLKDTELQDTQKRYLDGIDHSANNLMQILSDVLDYSDLLADRTKLNPQPIDVHELAKEVDEMIRPLVLTRPIRLVTLVSHSLTERLCVDRLRLKQVLIHLLDNAMKFTIDGCVELQVKKMGDKVRFAVRDTGIGIAPEMQRAILEPFTQVNDRSDSPYPGVGLGLSTASELLKLMGSKLCLMSIQGSGSTFYFDLAL